MIHSSVEYSFKRDESPPLPSKKGMRAPSTKGMRAPPLQKRDESSPNWPMEKARVEFTGKVSFQQL